MVPGGFGSEVIQRTEKALVSDMSQQGAGPDRCFGCTAKPADPPALPRRPMQISHLNPCHKAARIIVECTSALYPVTKPAKML